MKISTAFDNFRKELAETYREKKPSPAFQRSLFMLLHAVFTYLASMFAQLNQYTLKLIQM